MKRLTVAILLFASPLAAKEPQLNCEKKFGEIEWQGMTFHRYRLRAENFPPKQTFHLIVKSFEGTRTETLKYIANNRGHLILQPPEDLQGDIYAICPAKRGERLIFQMQQVDGGPSYQTELVPFPLAMKSKKGIRLNLELQGEHGEKFLLFAQGFKLSEPVNLILQVGEKETDLSAEVTTLGDLCAQILLPIDPTGGEAKLVLTRKNETVVFPFEWGAPALKYVGACCFEIR